MPHVSRALVVVVVAALGGSLPAAADWLLMRDGTRVEIQGEWRVEGTRVLFHLPGGTLASMPLSQVDLEATTRVAEEARRPPATQPPPTRRNPVLVLTDKDVAKAPSGEIDPPEVEAAPSRGAEAGEAPLASAGRVSASGFEVSSWTGYYNSESGGYEVVGTLQNLQESLAFNVHLLVRAYDEEGTLLEEGLASLTRPGIHPKGSVGFRSVLPGVVLAARVEFALMAQRAGRAGLPPDVGDDPQQTEMPLP